MAFNLMKIDKFGPQFGGMQWVDSVYTIEKIKEWMDSWTHLSVLFIEVAFAFMTVGAHIVIKS